MAVLGGENAPTSENGGGGGAAGAGGDAHLERLQAILVVKFGAALHCLSAVLATTRIVHVRAHWHVEVGMVVVT